MGHLCQGVATLLKLRWAKGKGRGRGVAVAISSLAYLYRAVMKQKALVLLDAVAVGCRIEIELHEEGKSNVECWKSHTNLTHPVKVF